MSSEFVQTLAGWIHAIGVATYVGGSIAMEFILGPAQKAIPPAQAQVMGQKTADRFLWFVWGALLLIVGSGLTRLVFGGHELGGVYMAKIALFAVLVINGAIITFVLRPKLAGRAKSGTSAAGAEAHQESQMKAATWVLRLTRIDLGVALFVMLLGASLGAAVSEGGH